MVRPPFDNFTKPDAAPTVISSSRRLLSRLRGTIAGDGKPQERLDSIVSSSGGLFGLCSASGRHS